MDNRLHTFMLTHSLIIIPTQSATNDLPQFKYPSRSYHYFTNLCANDRFKEDDYFAQQRLAGINPITIRRVAFGGNRSKLALTRKIHVQILQCMFLSLAHYLNVVPLLQSMSYCKVLFLTTMLFSKFLNIFLN